MDLKTQIEGLLAEILTEEYFVVEVQFIQKRPTSKLIVLIDGDNGIGIDMCVSVSRQLSAKLDENNWIETAYTLEVSSPGIDKPLIFKRQYTKNIGRKLKIQLKDGSLVSGILHLVEESTITLMPEGKTKKSTENQEPIQIQLEEVQKANVLVSFN